MFPKCFHFLPETPFSAPFLRTASPTYRSIPPLRSDRVAVRDSAPRFAGHVRISCGTLAATLWLRLVTTLGAFSSSSTTRTSRIPCAIRSSRLTPSGASGATEIKPARDLAENPWQNAGKRPCSECRHCLQARRGSPQTALRILIPSARGASFEATKHPPGAASLHRLAASPTSPPPFRVD
jgi:hypothetical protein